MAIKSALPLAALTILSRCSGSTFSPKSFASVVDQRGPLMLVVSSSSIQHLITTSRVVGELLMVSRIEGREVSVCQHPPSWSRATRL